MPAAAPSPSARRGRVLGVAVDIVDMAAAIDRVADLMANRPEHGALVVTLNPEMVMLARRDPGFAAIIDRAALVIPDGIGVVRALQHRGASDAIRVGGADLVDGLLPHAAATGRRVALVGGGPGVAAAAAVVYRARHPTLEVLADGGDPLEATAHRVAEWAPDVVLAAYGHGRQERFLSDHLDRIGAAVGIGVGGTLDYAAGIVRRAPTPVRNAGLEWAWRLGRQPWRVRRQLALPAFWWQERRELELHPDRGRC